MRPSVAMAVLNMSSLVSFRLYCVGSAGALQELIRGLEYGDGSMKSPNLQLQISMHQMCTHCGFLSKQIDA